MAVFGYGRVSTSGQHTSNQRLELESAGFKIDFWFSDTGISGKTCAYGASSHSGRRTFATVLSSKGVGIRVLMRAMGHRNISTTIGYVDASDDMLRKAVDLA